MKLLVKMDKQGRIVIPKEIRNRLQANQKFELDYIEDYIVSEPYDKRNSTAAIILEICNERKK